MTFELYSWNTPNGQKAQIALEEAGADYSLIPIDISAGQQHSDAFKAISPDGKIPALVYYQPTTADAIKTDPCAQETPEKITLFESGAILMFLAEHFPQLHADTPQQRASVLSWVFWQVGQLGPLAGQFGRFQALRSQSQAADSGPDQTDYETAINHFEQLVWRCLNVLENRLATSSYLAGPKFTVADIASYTWVASNQSYLQRYQLPWRQRCTNLQRWADSISQRPSLIRLDLAFTGGIEHF